MLQTIPVPRPPCRGHRHPPTPENFAPNFLTKILREKGSLGLGASVAPCTRPISLRRTAKHTYMHVAKRLHGPSQRHTRANTPDLCCPNTGCQNRRPRDFFRGKFFTRTCRGPIAQATTPARRNSAMASPPWLRLLGMAVLAAACKPHPGESYDCCFIVFFLKEKKKKREKEMS